jgi:hypothetical protein
MGFIEKFLASLKEDPDFDAERFFQQQPTWFSDRFVSIELRDWWRDM